MGAARFEYIGLMLAAIAYFQKRISVLEVVIFVGAAWVICEVASRKISNKIDAWPSDRENADRVMNLLASNAAMDEVMCIHFGFARSEFVDVLRKVANPELHESMFNDADLRNSYRYLQEKVRQLLLTVDSEMYLSNIPGQIELPLEWKAWGNPLYQRYRDAQAKLLRQGRDVVEAVKAFANCYQGAAKRL